MAIKELVFILSIIFLPLMMEAKQPVKREGKHIVRCLLATTFYKQPLCKYSFCVCFENSLIRYRVRPTFRLELGNKPKKEDFSKAILNLCDTD